MPVRRASAALAMAGLFMLVALAFLFMLGTANVLKIAP